MAKELPYFQFEPAEYLTKDVSFCSLQAQGLFINICSYYWQRNCDITKEQVLKRLNYPTELEELFNEGIIDIENNKIVIKFLDNQMVNATKTSVKNSKNGSLGGRPKKPNESQTEPKLNPNESQTKGIREDKIIKEEIIKKNIEDRKADFKKSFTPFLLKFDRTDLNDFFKYWTEHGLNDKKMRFEKEKSFGIERRLETWIKNKEKFAVNDKKEKKQTGAEAFKNLVYGSVSNL